jgi:hypothetical protein
MATVLDTVAFHYIGNIYKTQNHHLNVLHWLRTNQKNLFLMSTIHNNKKSWWCTVDGAPLLTSSRLPTPSPSSTTPYTKGRSRRHQLHCTVNRSRTYIFMAAASSPCPTTLYTKVSNTTTSSQMRLLHTHGRHIVASFHLGLKTKECIIKIE